MGTDYQLRNAVWEFTLDCNLNCLHCGSSAGSSRADELTTAEAEQLCRDLQKTGCHGITLMGGEPLLRKDFWRIATLIRDLGMELTVITNGTVFERETFSRLQSLSPRAVAVSIDAAQPKLHDRIRNREGAFDKSLDFVKHALMAGLPVTVITTVHKLNLTELPAIRELLLGRKIAWQIQIAGAEGRRFPRELLLDEEEFYSVGMFIAATRKKYPREQMPVIGAHDLGFNSQLLDNISLAPRWSGCQAGISVLGIQSNGTIKGCLSLDDSMVEGTLRERNISEVWQSEAAFPYSRSFTAAAAGENCSGCRHLDSCKGGCNEMSLMKTGLLHNDPYCFHRIEQRLFAKELRNPWQSLLIKVRRRLTSVSSRDSAGKW